MQGTPPSNLLRAPLEGLGKTRQNLKVAGEPRERGGGVGINPTNLPVARTRPCMWALRINLREPEAHGAIPSRQWPIARGGGRGYAGTQHNGSAKFFMDLAVDSGFRCFPIFDFSAGKFP